MIADKIIKKDYLQLIGWIYYLCTNSFFIIKYGSRALGNSELLLTLLTFLILIHFVIFSIYRFRHHDKSIKGYTLFTISIFTLYSLFINIVIDPHTINVDRWSALNNSIHNLLQGEYPYTALTHLNGRSSNLPGLLLIGIPFYLLGNVGFLQTFCFLLMAICTFRVIRQNWIRLMVIVLFISAPAYHWELFAKSDLHSNFIIITVFMLWNQQKKSHQLTDKPYTIGIITTVLFLTRLTSFIPLSILLVRDFFHSKNSVKLKFIVTSLSAFIVLWLLVLYQAPSIDVIREYNPVSLQSTQLALPLSISCIIISIVFAFQAKTSKQKMLYSFVFLTLPVILSFVQTIINSSFRMVILESYNDLSYLSIPLPFLIFGIALSISEVETSKI